MDEFRQTLSQSLGMVFLLTLPSSVGLVVLGKSIIGAIYQGGKFQLYDTQQTALGAFLLRDRLGRIRGAEGAESGVLRVGRRAHADAGEPGLDRDQLRDRQHHDRVGGLRPRGPGAVDLGGRVVRIRDAVRDSAQRIGGIHGRELAAQLGKVSAASLAMGGVVALSSHAMAAHGWAFRNWPAWRIWRCRFRWAGAFTTGCAARWA